VADLHRRMLQAPARFTTWLPMALAVALQATSGVDRPIIARERR
jgi:hypothetical protein